MPINFPSSPTLNQTYAFGQKTWIWNGYAWDLQLANANSVIAISQASYNQANAAFIHANAAFTQANTASGADQYARNTANSAFIQANASFIHANSAFDAANNALDTWVRGQANAAFIQANAAFLQANTPSHVANSAAIYANGAFVRANNSLDANVGGIVTGNVTVTQNLTVTGNISVSGNLFTSIPANGNTSAYATKYLVEYNPVSREFSYSSTPNASNPYITGYSSEIHVSPVAFNDSGKGTIGDPVKTIARAKELLALAFETTGVGQRKTIILHPGDYVEDVTIDTQFTTLTTHELIGKNTTLTGTLTITKGCTIEGLKMTNLVISATAANGTVDLIGCTVTTAITKTSSAYTVLRGCDLSSATLSVTGAGNTILVGGNYGSLTVNNASAGVLAKSVITMGPTTLTAGTLQIADTIVYSATNSSNAITQNAGSVLTLNNSQILIPTLTDVARVNLGGFYSILHSVYDKPNSTFGGTSLNAISYSQYINADKVTLSSGGSLVFPDSTIQITAAAPYAYSNAAYNHANSGFIQANAAFNTGNAAFVRANNSLNANVGGTITGDVIVVGNVTSNSLTTTGSNGSISGANAIFSNYVFAANGTVDLFIYANNAYTTANGAFAAANAAIATDATQNNSITAAFLQANTPSHVANSAAIYANGAFAAANASAAIDVTQNNSITAAFAAANAATATNVTQNNSIIAAFAHANAAFEQANSGGGGGTVTVSTFNATANGAQTTFEIGFSPVSADAVQVTIDGLIQPETSYTANANANTITFLTAPVSGEQVRVLSFYTGASAFVINDGSITPIKLSAETNNYINTIATAAATAEALSMAAALAIALG
jgi:hypothetical protein